MTSEALPRSVSAPREASPRAGRRGSPLWGGILFCVLAIWTLLISTVPDMRFQILLPRARLPIETVGVVVTALASMFAYVRYSVGGSRRALLLSIAFLILSFNHLVFGLLIQPGRFGISPPTDVYLWTAGRRVRARRVHPPPLHAGADSLHGPGLHRRLPTPRVRHHDRDRAGMGGSRGGRRRTSPGRRARGGVRDRTGPAVRGPDARAGEGGSGRHGQPRADAPGGGDQEHG